MSQERERNDIKNRMKNATYIIPAPLALPAFTCHLYRQYVLSLMMAPEFFAVYSNYQR